MNIDLILRNLCDPVTLCIVVVFIGLLTWSLLSKPEKPQKAKEKTAKAQPGKKITVAFCGYCGCGVETFCPKCGTPWNA